jgi:hypothetical protein
MYRILWADDGNYADLIPEEWCQSDGVLNGVVHEVIGPRGRRYPAKCDVTVKGSRVFIDYKPYEDVNFIPGVTRFDLSTSGDRLPTKVMWKSKGRGEKFVEYENTVVGRQPVDSSMDGGLPKTRQGAFAVLGDTSRPNWAKAYAAVIVLGDRATLAAVGRTIARYDTSFKGVNAGPDLCKITVNCLARGHHQSAAEPRRTDSGHRFDLLYKRWVGGEVIYVPYDPGKHGVWEVYIDRSASTKSSRRVRKLEMGTIAESIRIAEDASDEQDVDDFGSEKDMRDRAVRAIVARRGQQAFRRRLLEAYEGRCAISGCDVEAVLEAAHIASYNGKATNDVRNGILLRADLHTLFDLGKIWIENSVVRVAHYLIGTRYGKYEGRPLVQPSLSSMRPSIAALNTHAKNALSAPG